MQWFRFYADSLNNPKIQNLPPDLFKIWVNILCAACADNGKLPSANDLSFLLRLPLHGVTEALKSLQDAKLIVTVDETLHIYNWKKRQYKSDSSADRVKRHRKRYSNGNVTPPEQIQNRYRTDTEQIQNTPLPPWLPKPQWEEFIEMRKAIKSPMTARAEKRMLAKLEVLFNNGIDIKERLEQSIINNWKDVYEKSREQFAAKRPSNNVADQAQRLIAELYAGKRES